MLCLLVFMDDVREAISIADIGFVLSKHEALSIACREMMAMGKPVLISDCGGLLENIDNNKNGWVVQKGSINQILEFLQKLNKLDLDYFSQSANKKAIQEFGLKHFIDKTLEIYS